MFVQIFQQNPWESRTHLIYSYNDLQLSLPLQQSLPKKDVTKKKRNFTICTGARITNRSHKSFLYVSLCNSI